MLCITQLDPKETAAYWINSCTPTVTHQGRKQADMTSRRIKKTVLHNATEITKR